MMLTGVREAHAPSTPASLGATRRKSDEYQLRTIFGSCTKRLLMFALRRLWGLIPTLKRSARLLPSGVARVGDRADVRGSGRSPRQPGANTPAGKPLGVRLPVRAKRDGELSIHIRQVFEDN